MTVLKLSVLSSHRGHRILITGEGIRLKTPPLEHLAFYAGVGALAVAEVIEWPVALTLAAGHLLTGLTHRPALLELGEAVEGAGLPPAK